MLSFAPFKMGFNECKWNEAVNVCLEGASSLACNTKASYVYSFHKKYLDKLKNALENNLSNQVACANKLF